MATNISRENLEFILQAVWPMECQIVGPELLEMIAEGDTGFEYDSGGSHLDLTTLLELLKLSVEIVIIGIHVKQIVEKIGDSRKNIIAKRLSAVMESEYDLIPAEKRKQLLNEVEQFSHRNENQDHE